MPAYFSDANHDVLQRSARVRLRQRRSASPPRCSLQRSYDLITLEPPPIASCRAWRRSIRREFYELARTRLTSEGLHEPVAPRLSSARRRRRLAMIRAFVDVFPQAVLLSGAAAESTADRQQRSERSISTPRQYGHCAWRRAPAVHERSATAGPWEPRDEIVGTVRRLRDRPLRGRHGDASPVTDDHPVQEYGVGSLPSTQVCNASACVPSSTSPTAGGVVSRAASVNGKPVPRRWKDSTRILRCSISAYAASPERSRARTAASRAHEGRVSSRGSAYLGAVVPESADVHDILGVDFASKGALDDAIEEFRAALGRDPSAAKAHWHLGRALVSSGRRDEGIEHLRASVELRFRQWTGPIRSGDRAPSGGAARGCHRAPARDGAADAEPCGRAQQSRHRTRLTGQDGRSDSTVSDGARARSRVRRDAAQSVSGHARTTTRARPLRFVGAAIVGESFLLTDP